MPISINSFFSKEYSSEFTAISGIYPDIAVIAEYIGIFYE
jgi:hypothetical protein